MYNHITNEVINILVIVVQNKKNDWTIILELDFKAVVFSTNETIQEIEFQL